MLFSETTDRRGLARIEELQWICAVRLRTLEHKPAVARPRYRIGVVGSVKDRLLRCGAVNVLDVDVEVALAHARKRQASVRQPHRVPVHSCDWRDRVGAPLEVEQSDEETTCFEARSGDRRPIGRQLDTDERARGKWQWRECAAAVDPGEPALGDVDR